MDQVASARILVLLTFRPEYSLPWTSRAKLTQITLSRLTRKQVEVMVEKVAGDKALPAEVTHQIVTKTDGVPLFVEELTKMVLESGLLREREGHYELMVQLLSLAIPATLHDSLMARLDRLARAKEVAQMGATIGRKLVMSYLTPSPFLTKRLYRATEPVSGSGTALPEGLRRRQVLLQACADSGHRLSLVAQEHEAAVISRLRRCWRSGFPRPLRPSLSCWPITTRRRV